MERGSEIVTLTKRQKELLDYLEGYIRRYGFAPTLDETGKHFGLTSLATVHKHLTNLEDKGFIRRRSGMSRALEVVPQRQRAEAIELPLLGIAAAGRPIEAVLDEKVAVPEDLVRKPDSYVLKVSGDSMRDDGILDGDLIGVHRTPTASSGQIVVARIDDEITVKRLKIGKDGIRLLPRNPEYQPIEVRPDQDFAIEGLYCGLVRPSR